LKIAPCPTHDISKVQAPDPSRSQANTAERVAGTHRRQDDADQRAPYKERISKDGSEQTTAQDLERHDNRASHKRRRKEEET
jgi:hypothetical protein